MIERDRVIYIGRDEDTAAVLRELLALPDVAPAEIQLDVGSRQVLVTERVQQVWAEQRSGPDLDSVQEPEHDPARAPEQFEQEATPPADPPAEIESTPAPRKRAPRKAPAAEETTDA